MVVVIGISALVLALLATAISIVVSGQRYARQDVSWNGALAAAYAGVEEYQSRIAADWSYVYKGNPQAPFSSTSELTPDASNPALGFDDSWATVPGSNGSAEFRYEVDSSAYDGYGTLRLRSTGRVGQEVRTVVADLRQDGFLKYLYFTDFEVQDPWQSGESASCGTYFWSRPSTGCAAIHFGGGDQVEGRVHSNDVIFTCQATFHDEVSTAWTGRDSSTGMRFKRIPGCTSGERTTFQRPDPQGGGPFYRNRLEMPQTNIDIRADALEWGCVFTGPTRITMQADGFMRVRSPLSRVTRPGAVVSNPSGCGTVGTGTDQLGSTNGARIPVPENGAIYVQNANRAVGDPNYHASKPSYCTNSSNSNGVGYPAVGEVVPSAIGSVAAYGCTNGDIFVEGVVDGQVTLAAENYVYVVGDIKYEDSERDILGLIGNSMVWVHNPAFSCQTSYSPDRCSINSPNRRIDAAIMSLRSFSVQNVTKVGDTDGILTVNGSIVQRYRGVVRQYSGYIKNYQYDDRLLFRSPPHFLSPMNSNYGVSTWVETDAIDVDESW
ncbi:hypothetical protein [Agrococcus citreus]